MVTKNNKILVHRFQILFTSLHFNYNSQIICNVNKKRKDNAYSICRLNFGN